MATKWRRFSTNSITKIILIIIIAVTSAVIGGVSFRAYTNPFGSGALETFIHTDYFKSYSFINDFSKITNKISNKNTIENDSVIESYLKSLEHNGIYANIKIISADGRIEKNFETSDVKKSDAAFYYTISPSQGISGSANAPDITSSYQCYTSYGVLELGFTNAYVQNIQEQWNTVSDNMVIYSFVLGISLILGLSSLIWILSVSGLSPEGEKTTVKLINKAFTEIQVALPVLSVAATASVIYEASSYNLIMYNIALELAGNTEYIIDMWMYTCGISILTAISALLIVYFFSSLIIKIRNKILTKTTLVGIILLWCVKIIKKIFGGIRICLNSIKQSIDTAVKGSGKAGKILNTRWIALICFLSISGFIMLMALAANEAYILAFILIISGIAAIAYLVSEWFAVKHITEIEKQLDSIYNGQYHPENKISEKSIFYPMSQKIISLGSNFEKNVEKRVKSERMKINLVTNVSHDLKTPLTSIISYVDLLSKEDLSPEAMDYVTVLSSKSERLKNIVSDLFELAKTTSGEIPIEHEDIDLCRLIQQTLGDMDDKITGSDIVIKTSVPDCPVIINSDGKRLYRVVQNLIDNALKYSLQNTRIYILLNVLKDTAELSVKNTASYEMNFTSEEILERFARGDESRTTEGSGLGLSIAQGFTIACGGTFDLQIDGDQFKVVIKFKLKNELS